jgi:hypothetical protein
MTADELTGELRELTKQLLAYGAKIPKELMLFVKDILFLDGAVATLRARRRPARRDRLDRHLLRRAPRRAHRRGDRHRPARASRSTSTGVRNPSGRCRFIFGPS